MGLFSFFKKSPAKQEAASDPYKDSATNLIYNLLFCDNLDLYKESSEASNTYPFDILFSETSSTADLQKIIDDSTTDPRVKILAYNRQLANGYKPEKKLLAVIVEIGLEDGLDVLASFYDGTARYINHSGKMVFWETTTDENANEITDTLFLLSQDVISQIGPWDKPRKPHPAKGNARITFLVSDGLYFGEGQTDVLFNDPLAASALTAATLLMKYLTEKTLEKE